MNFHKLFISHIENDVVLIFIDRFRKRLVIILCYKTIIAKEIAWLFI